MGAVIGTQGSQIKEIQEISGARVNFKDESSVEKEKDRIVIIRGTSESAQTAELLIRKIVAEQPVIVTKIIYVPQRAVGRIIGRGGDTVRHMSQASKCKISVDRSENFDTDVRRITLSGSAQAIANAQTMIAEKLEEEEAYRARVAAGAATQTGSGSTTESHRPIPVAANCTICQLGNCHSAGGVVCGFSSRERGQVCLNTRSSWKFMCQQWNTLATFGCR